MFKLPFSYNVDSFFLLVLLYVKIRIKLLSQGIILYGIFLNNYGYLKKTTQVFELFT